MLIASSNIGDKLWAVEKVRHGICALCKLSNWVTVEMLERSQARLCDVLPTQETQYTAQTQLAGDEWWQSTAIHLKQGAEDFRTTLNDYQKTRTSALCLQRPVQTFPSGSQSASQVLPTKASDAGPTIELVTDEKTQAPQEILDMIRNQYKEALYASKVWAYVVTLPVLLLMV